MPTVLDRGPHRLGHAGPAAVPAVALAGVMATETNLQITAPLLWVMLALTVAGAIITYAFMVYAVWRFRDPTTKRRRHG
ncbi:MAG: hypothetical protein WB947_02575 [Thermoplasmata archaeon]